MIVHNGNNPNVVKLTQLHPHLHFAALAPHVAQHSRENLHVHTHWLLSVMPFHASVRGCAGHGQGASAHCMACTPTTTGQIQISHPAARSPGVSPSLLQNPCVLSSNSPLCLHGFSIQGNFEPQRRNYTRMWQMLQVGQGSSRLWGGMGASGTAACM